MTNVAKFYDRLAEKHGATPKAVDAYNQRLLDQRYEALSEVCDLHGKTVLDVGCNYGGLGRYLLGRGMAPENYTGIDISEKAVEVGQKENPDLNIIHADLRTYAPVDILRAAPKQFDIVMAQGIFYKLPNDAEGGARVLELIQQMAKLSKFAIAYTTVWSGGRTKIPGINWLEPAAMLGYMLGMTPWVTLRTEYMEPMDADFCIYAYKEKP